MSGLVGLFAFDSRWNVSRFLYFSLKGVQNRGQETAGLTVSDLSDMRSIRGVGLVEEVLKEREIEKLGGPIGIAAVSADKTVMPFTAKRLAMGFNGCMLDPKDDVQNLFSELSGGTGLGAGNGTGNGKGREIEEIAQVLERRQILGSLVGMGNDCLFAYRDPHGLRPLLKGNLGFDLALISSELGAMDTIGSDFFFDVEPGELCYFNKYGFEKERIKKENPRYCAFEYIYLSRPDNVWNGVHMEDVRYRIGQKMAQENPPDTNNSVVIAVPETARPFANGFSDEAGIPQRLGFESVGRQLRTAIIPSQFERMMGIQLKHNVIRSAVYGKKVYVLDDSVVRGNTMRNTVFWLRKRGAKEVHIRIGSPHLISPCRYGIEVPIRDELIAAHNSEEEIAKVIDADSFAYLSPESVVGCVGLPEKEMCMACMTGEYPFW